MSFKRGLMRSLVCVHLCVPMRVQICVLTGVHNETRQVQHSRVDL